MIVKNILLGSSPDKVPGGETVNGETVNSETVNGETVGQ
jgi:hypothetical protein